MKKITILTALLCSSMLALAQSTDEESIKKTIQAESDARAARSFDAWKALWVHDSNVVTTFASRNGYSTSIGWDSLSAVVARTWKSAPKPIWTQYKTENFHIRQNGNMAVAYFDAVVTP